MRWLSLEISVILDLNTLVHLDRHRMMEYYSSQERNKTRDHSLMNHKIKNKNDMEIQKKMSPGELICIVWSQWKSPSAESGFRRPGLGPGVVLWLWTNWF